MESLGLDRVLNQIFGICGVGILIVSNDGIVRHINAPMLEIINPPSGENPAGKYIKDILQPFAGIIEQLEKNMKVEEQELKIGNRWVHINCGHVSDATGKPITHVIISTDITSQKEIELDLKRSEAKLNSIIDTIPDVIYRLDTEGRIVYINDVIKEYGYMPDELIGRDVMELVHSSDRDKARYRLNERRTGERMTRHFEVRLLTKQSSAIMMEIEETDVVDHRMFLVNSIGLYATDNDTKRQFLGTQGIARDITRKRTAEYALHISEERTRGILNTLADGYYEVDLEGIFTFVNKSICKLTYYNEDEIIGKDFHILFPNDSAQNIVDTFQSLLEAETDITIFNWEIIRKDGKKRFVEISASLIFDVARKPVGIRGIIRDVTLRKKVEEELILARKIEAIGIMAGGIAHDYNNALTAILGNLSLAKMEVGKDDVELIEVLIDAEKAAFKVLELTKRLSLFAQGGKPRLVTVESNILNDIIRDAVESALDDFTGDYIISVDDNLNTVEIDCFQFEHAIKHIITNAKEAMPNGGTITIEVKNVTVESEKSYHELTLHSDKYVMITIKDVGPGIKKEIQDKVFDPYFTTKEFASGMGLAISYAIIKRHHAFIDLISEEGKGTIINIYLAVVYPKV